MLCTRFIEIIIEDYYNNLKLDFSHIFTTKYGL